MTVGARLREERKRLGLNQTEFATIAGASKRAMVNWESDGAAPMVTALVAWAEAGADALYIVTGRRTADRPEDEARIDDRLAEIRRNMLVTAWEPHFEGEDGADAEARVLESLKGQIGAILSGRAGPLTAEQREQAETLLAIADSPAQLATLRATDRAQRHTKRRRLRERIHMDTALGDFHPTAAVVDTMMTLVLDHGAPLDLLLRLFYEIVIGEDEPDWPAETGAEPPT